MTEDQVKQIVIDIIAEIAPDEDTSNIKPSLDSCAAYLTPKFNA
jgi:hypothetical protein